jgi:hypothetical protein
MVVWLVGIIVRSVSCCSIPCRGLLQIWYWALIGGQYHAQIDKCLATIIIAHRGNEIIPGLRAGAARQKGSVGLEEVERRLAEILRATGEDALNRIRDQARSIAPLRQCWRSAMRSSTRPTRRG